MKTGRKDSSDTAWAKRQLADMGLTTETLLALPVPRRRALRRVFLSLLRETEAESQKGEARGRGIDASEIYVGLILYVETKKGGPKHCVVAKLHGNGRFKCWFGDGKVQVVWIENVLKVYLDRPVVPMDIHTHKPMQKAQDQLMALWLDEYPARARGRKVS